MLNSAKHLKFLTVNLNMFNCTTSTYVCYEAYLCLNFDIISCLLQLKVSLSFSNFCIIQEPDKNKE
jgi:hypothetical protein